MLLGFTFGVVFVLLVLFIAYLFGQNRVLSDKLVPIITENDNLKALISAYEASMKQPRIINITDEQLARISQILHGDFPTKPPTIH